MVLLERAWHSIAPHRVESHAVVGVASAARALRVSLLQPLAAEPAGVIAHAHLGRPLDAVAEPITEVHAID
jgi:hypothetical protein